MLDINNSFLLFQDSKDNRMYKAPLRALEGMFALANGETEDVQNLVESIDSLSLLILDVSAYVSATCYCREEVEKKFEMLSSTNFIPNNPEILTEKQIPKYADKHDLVKYEDAEAAVMEVEQEVDKYFEHIDKESDSYF
jgi:hypothetical protein